MKTRMVLVAAALAGGLSPPPSSKRRLHTVAEVSEAEATSAVAWVVVTSVVAWVVITSLAVPTSQLDTSAVAVLVVRWAGHTLPQVPGTAVLGGMQAALLGTAIGTATTCIAMITITSPMTTITSGIAS